MINAAPKGGACPIIFLKLSKSKDLHAKPAIKVNVITKHADRNAINTFFAISLVFIFITIVYGFLLTAPMISLYFLITSWLQ